MHRFVEFKESLFVCHLVVFTFRTKVYIHIGESIGAIKIELRLEAHHQASHLRLASHIHRRIHSRKALFVC
jgi:hypothetical protein